MMQTVRTAHDQMLDDKRSEILETVRQCMEATHTAANGDPKALDIVRKSDAFFDGYKAKIATVYKGNIIKNLIMDCQSYTKYRPNETTGGIFVSWRRKEELPTGA